MLPISEIFCSIQGEGVYSGTPSFFIRTIGCNLRCKWGDTLCDTPYTSHEPEKGELLSIEAIYEKLQSFNKPEVSHVVITGGEPFLHEDTVRLIELLTYKNYLVTIETNGTHLPYFTGVPSQILLSISPKLASSTPKDNMYAETHEKTRIIKDRIFERLPAYNHIFKFVIHDDSDIQEVKQMIQKRKINKNRIYLMPEGITSEDVRKGMQKLVPLCIENGWHLSDRMHLHLFGNKRGV